MGWRRLQGAVIAAAVALVMSCDQTPQEPRPSFGCEELPWPGVVPLCRKVSQELEYTRGGHGLIRGSLGWFCTQRTVERVVCSGTPIDVAQVKEALAFGASPEQEKVFFDTRLYVCLLDLLHVAEPTTLAPEQRYAARVNCPPKS